jgi:outer membrane protein TolC
MNVLLGALLLTGLTASVPAQEMTLDQCLRLAMVRNPALTGAAARRLEAKADFDGARAPLRTTVFANAFANQLNEDRLSPLGASLPAGASLYTREGFAGLTARQLLYDGGRSSGGMDVAARGIDVQREALAVVHDETIFRVSRIFYRALATAELVRVARDAASRDQAFESMTAELFRAGKVTRLDALKAASARVEAERVLAAAGEAAALSIVQLVQTIGLDRNTRLVPIGALPSDLAEPPPGDDAFIAAFARSPDLRRATYELEQAQTSLRLAGVGNSPAISLLGGYGFRERNVGGGRPEWLVGFTASWLLVDGGALPAQLSRAQARVAQAGEARRALELDIGAQVHGALAGWRTALSDARAAARLVETGHEALAAAEALYRAGKATALDVLTAQSDLARVEGGRVTAVTDYVIARAQLERLTGAPVGGTAR